MPQHPINEAIWQIANDYSRIDNALSLAKTLNDNLRRKLDGEPGLDDNIDFLSRQLGPALDSISTHELG